MRPFAVTTVWTRSHRRADRQGQRDPDPDAEQARRLQGLLPDRGRQRHLQLDRPLRDPEQGEASTKVASTWVRDEKLETAFPNPPKITSGKVVGHKNGVVGA